MGWGCPPSQDAGSWQMKVDRLGFPILKMVHNPGGDDCILGRGITQPMGITATAPCSAALGQIGHKACEQLHTPGPSHRYIFMVVQMINIDGNSII